MNHHLHIFLFIACVLCFSVQAQTPFDSFASEVSRPILELASPPSNVGLLQLSTDTTFPAIVVLVDDLNKWLSVDPLSDKYPSISPYAYCNWNPLKYMDPDGRWIAVVSNDDTGTSYNVVGGAVDVDDCSVYIVGDDYNTKNDRKPNNAAILGQTVTPYSFCNEKGEVLSGSTINMNDKSGDAFIAQFQNNEISLFHYIFDDPHSEGNQSGRNGGNCDFKYGTDVNRGMPLSILGGKIGTARDVVTLLQDILRRAKVFRMG